MPDSSEIIKNIIHYQKSIERYTQRNDSSKILRCIFKLFSMPVTMSHLENTGVGITVNSLRKLGGEVEEAAKTLVKKWKQMVSESDQQNDSSHKSSDKHKSSDRDKRGKNENSSRSEEEDDEDSSDDSSEQSDESEHKIETKSKEKYKKSDRYREEPEPSPKKKESHESKNHSRRSPDHKSDRKRKHEESSNRYEENSSKHEEISPDHKSDRKRKHEESSNRHEENSSKREENSSKHEDKKRSREDKSNSSRHNHSSSSHRKERDSKSSKDKERSESSSSRSKTSNSKRDSSGNSSNERSKSKNSSKSTSNNQAGKTQVEIGSESGTSFAEALGMLEPPTTSKNSGKKPKVAEAIYKPERTETKPVEKEKEKVKSSKSEKIDISIPPPPKLDIDINISSLLPTITPNYRPVVNHDSFNQRSRSLNDEEALSMVMYQKNMRTKVFSGNKTYYGNIPTLFELCIRILQDNIDALEYTGGVPFSILKPILDKATPEQLFMLEHHNPYLIEDTDEIWKFHCHKEFRSKKREEMETCRDMYMRCLDEREAKLKALTENIKQAQDKSIPVRQTKLAYVDSVVKPPRDVLRKQAKSGLIEKRPAVTPTSRLNSIVASAAVGQVSVPNPVRASSSGGSSAAVKPKKAPLMQKTLQFLKGNRFRR